MFVDEKQMKTTTSFLFTSFSLSSVAIPFQHKTNVFVVKLIWPDFLEIWKATTIYIASIYNSVCKCQMQTLICSKRNSCDDEIGLYYYKIMP